MDMNNVPAHLAGNRRSLAQESTQGMALPPVPFISIEGQKFTLVDVAGNKWQPPTMGPIFPGDPKSPMGVYIDVVVMDTNKNMSKTYYEKDYNPNETNFKPPECWSDNGIAPSVSANSPQAARCDLCPKNKWGSKINNLGNEVKACDDVKKLAVYYNGIAQLFLLRIKGSSHKNWTAYVEWLGRHQVPGQNRRLDVVDVVTRIYFDPEYPIGILKFSNVAFIDANVAALQDKTWATDAAATLLGKHDRPRLIDASAAVQTAPQVAAQPQQQLQHAPPASFGAAQQETAPAATVTAPPAGFGANGGGQPQTQQPAQQAQPTPRKPRSPRRPPDPSTLPANPQPPQQPQSGGAAATAATTGSPPPNFGIVNPGAPDGEVNEALNQALRPLN